MNSSFVVSATANPLGAILVHWPFCTNTGRYLGIHNWCGTAPGRQLWGECLKLLMQWRGGLKPRLNIWFSVRDETLGINVFYVLYICFPVRQNGRVHLG